MRAGALLLVAILLPSAVGAEEPPAAKPEARVQALIEEAKDAYASGDWDKALTSVTKVLEIAPDDPDALELGGTLASASRAFEEADRMLSRACALRPERANCLVRLGDARLARALDCKRREIVPCRDEAIEGALEVFRGALRLDSDSVGAKRGVALALVAAERIEESIAACEAWNAASPADPESGIALVRALVEADRWEHLPSLVERLSEAHPEAAGTVGLRALGRLYENGRRTEGDALLDRLRGVDPSEVRQFGLKAIHLAVYRSYDRALDALVRYMAAGPLKEEAEVIYNAVVDRGPKMKGIAVDPPQGEIYQESATDISLPYLVRKAEPAYPEGLRRLRVEGNTTVNAVVRTDGTIGRVTILSATHPAFAVSALDAVKQWKYKPATQNGKPVAIYYTIRVDFRLGKPK